MAWPPGCQPLLGALRILALAMLDRNIGLTRPEANAEPARMCRVARLGTEAGDTVSPQAMQECTGYPIGLADWNRR
ncbi:MAG: hypothetical protein M3Z20_07040 [Chloroflexota bacterium]|nr:hypothetical protein [Chloroflexota bacterium]